MLVRSGPELRARILASGRYRSLAAFGRRIGYSRQFVHDACSGHRQQVPRRFVEATCEALDVQPGALFTMPGTSTPDRA
jgi:DNA-binding Xre family transcriptional regulator